MTSYSRARDAKRAALKSGLLDGEFEIIESDGRFEFVDTRDPELDSLIAIEQDMKDNPEKQIKSSVTIEELREIAQPKEETHICIAEPQPEPLKPVIPYVSVDPVDLPKPPTPTEPVKHASTCASPTKAVWDVADKMMEAAEAGNYQITRRMVLDACERAGIATYTARTQFQAWLTANRNSGRGLGALYLRGKRC